MKQYSGWQALFLSFWSSSLYKDVAKEWRGVGYLYLLAVICLTAFFVVLQIQVVVVPKLEQFNESMVNQLPAVTIEKGVLSIDKPTPYTIIEPKSGKAFITFDTRSKPMGIEESKSTLLITKDAIFSFTGSEHKNTSLNEISHGPGEKLQEEKSNHYLATDLRRYDLAPIDHFAIDAVSTQQIMHSFFHGLGLGLFVILVPCGFIFCLLQTLLYALIGKMFCSMSAVELSYSTLVRLCSVALTPALLLDSLQKVAVVQLPGWTLISIVLTLGYLYFGIIANRSEKVESTPPDTIVSS